MKIIAKILISVLSFLLLAVGSVVVIYSLLAFLIELRIYLAFDSSYSASFDLGRILTHSCAYLVYLVLGVVSVLRGSKLSRKLKRQDMDMNPFAFKSFLLLLITLFFIGIGIFYIQVKGAEANKNVFQMLNEQGYDLTTKEARQRTLEKIRLENGQ